MKELTKKVLESGLVDEATAALMERWGTLPEGAAALAKEPKLKDATREQLMKFAEDIGDEVEKKAKLRESMLDLNQIRWPAKVSIFRTGQLGEEIVADMLSCVIDRMGRYYFRVDDVDTKWFVPGFWIQRHMNVLSKAPPVEEILEADIIYLEEHPICVQVTTRRSP